MTVLRRAAVCGLLCAAVLPAAPAAAAPQDSGFDVLVFSKTAAFRHDSIEEGVAAIRQLGDEHGFSVTATEDAGAFNRGNLRRFDAVVFMSTTGDVLNPSQQRAFENYIHNGGGYAGVHSASDTEYDWPFYGGLVGAYFDGHPDIQPADVVLEDRAHDATAHLGATWTRTDEWYNFRTNPRDSVHVLASLDESSYSGGTMNGDHPIAWCQPYQGGRAFYTALGHTEESYADPAYLRHLLGGIRWAAGDVKADCRPDSGHTSLFDGTSTDGWSQAGPGSFTLQDDGTLVSEGGLGMLWYDAAQFENYSLKVDWTMEGDDNSGVFVGFPPSDDPWSAVDNGYEVQIDATDADDRTTGAVYSFQSANLKARDAALNPPGEWNTYEIRVEGERLRVFLNGVLVNDFTNTNPARDLAGHVGIQNHGEGDTVSFRNVRIAELPAATSTMSAPAAHDC